jgi:hypothetical protein
MDHETTTKRRRRLLFRVLLLRDYWNYIVLWTPLFVLRLYDEAQRPTGNPICHIISNVQQQQFLTLWFHCGGGGGSGGGGNRFVYSQLLYCCR